MVAGGGGGGEGGGGGGGKLVVFITYGSGRMQKAPQLLKLSWYRQSTLNCFTSRKRL